MPLSTPLNFLSWNCCGLGQPEAINKLEGLVKKFNLVGIFLMKTKCQRGKIELLCRRLGYANYIIVDPSGLAGGLELMWSNDIQVTCKLKSSRLIFSEITGIGGFESWVLLACHGTPYLREKKDFWQSLVDTVKMVDKLWLLVRDLNELLDEEEKVGGRSVWK